MKKQVIAFVCIASLVLAIVPAVNLLTGQAFKNDRKKWWRRSVLYNLDFALSPVNGFLYPAGISTAPNLAIIGKDGWLYLGDGYARTITVTRRGATRGDVEAAKTIGAATKSWEQWMSLMGVSLYKVILIPNKDTAYPEFLPDWLQPARNSVSNALLAHVPAGSYVDLRAAVRESRPEFAERLYFKTDTHWNSLGAWIAFRAFSRELARTESGLRWLSDQQIRILRVDERAGGDLANLLRIKAMLRDREVLMTIDSDPPVETEQYDFATGQLVVPGGKPHKGPVLVKSKHALNQKKVLWLQDSFGPAMAPYMAATFSETLQLRYLETDANGVARLVETFRPDYVFITVVERSVLDKWFKEGPP